MIVSADDHVLESPDTWTARMSKSKWGDRIPHVASEAQGDCWMIDGQHVGLLGRGSVSAALGDRAGVVKRWTDIPAGAYDPAERLRAMDADGVACSVLYPMVAGFAGETLCAIPDLEFQLACVQAYNDWLIEIWASKTDRFIPQCIVPLASGEVMAAEIRRAAGKGHRGAVMPMVPSLIRDDAPQLNDPAYEPVWKTCEELQIPIGLHAGVTEKLQLESYEGYSPARAQAFEAAVMPQSNPIGVANVLVSRMLDRYPRLKIVFGGGCAGWMNYMLETIENNFNMAATAQTLGYTRQPIDMFKAQCYVTTTYDDATTLRHACDSPGADNVLWASEFPLTVSTWPQSATFVDAGSSSLSDGEREKVYAGNVLSLYKIELPRPVPA